MSSRVFQPNLTSELLVSSSIEEAKTLISNNKDQFKLLDLGSGGCHVGVQLAKSLGLSHIWSSDLDNATLSVAKKAALENAIEIEHRIGDLFAPWSDHRFDLIVDDVSGVSWPVAKISPWFQGVPCNSGECGTLLIQRVLQEASKYMSEIGRLIFPIISLSAGHKILKVANDNFKYVRRLQKKQWPLPESMIEFKSMLQQQKEKHNVDYNEKYGMIICHTEIYLAYN